MEHTILHIKLAVFKKKFRPHRPHPVRMMWPVVTDVTCSMVCVIWRDDLHVSKEPLIRLGSRSDESFAAVRGDRSPMQPFAKSLWTLVVFATAAATTGSAQMLKHQQQQTLQPVNL